MCRVLIVEDELWNRRGIIKCIEWERLGMNLAAEAGNGEEALEWLERGGVDVVITDMKMPVCDGRRMLQEIERRGFDCEIIVLSEYTDFEYMRQAIHAHVYEYILKPIDEEELNDVLRRVGERVRSRRADEDRRKDPLYELYSCSGAESPRDQALLSRTLEKHRSFFEQKQLWVACLQLEGGGREEPLLASLQDCADAVMPDVRIFLHDPERRIFCLIRVFSPGENGRECASLLQSFRQACADRFNTRARAGMCSRRLCRPEDFLSVLSHGLAALQFLKKGEGEALAWESVERLAAVTDIPLFDEKQLTGVLRRGRREDGEHLRQTILQSVREAEYTYLPALRKAIVDFTLTLEKCCRREGYAVNISSCLQDNYIDRIGRLEWLGDLDEFLSLSIGCVMRAIADRHSQKEADVVGDIIRQLELCYAEEISLMSIAQKHHVNYIYLSRLFKERTGVNFTEFLLRLRMTKAAELIKRGGFKIKDVAQMVGYGNPYYFMSSYRKFYGNAPSEDRRRAAEETEGKPEGEREM